MIKNGIFSAKQIASNYALTLARVGPIHLRVRVGGGLMEHPPPRVSPLIELELWFKDERVASDKRKPMVPNF